MPRSPSDHSNHWTTSTVSRETSAAARGRLAVDREARVRVDLAPARVEAHVELQAGVAAADLDGVLVVVVAVLDPVDELGHDVAHDRRVLELVAARPDR